MAGLFGQGWRLPPPYETIADEQAQYMGGTPYSTPGYGAGTPGVAERSTPTRTGMFGNVLGSQPQKQGGFNAPGGWAQKLGSLGELLLTAGGSPLGPALMQQRQQGIQNQREDARLRWQQQREDARLNKPITPSNAAKMAAEIGLQPGTKQYADFIRRYAFKPTILQIPNAAGGIDYSEYDPSGADTPAPMQPGHVEDGYRFNGGDPADPNSWSKM